MIWSVDKVVSKGDYNYSVVYNHPRATKNGYVLEHRIVMENYLGRLLCPEEVVHHINNKKKDNDIENLELMLKEEHAKCHGSKMMRKYVILKCPWCGETFERAENQSFLVKKTEYTCCSLKCRGKISGYIRVNGRAEKM